MVAPDTAFHVALAVVDPICTSFSPDGVAGGVTAAVLKKLVEAGRLDPSAETVIFNTGDGLKTLDAIENHVGPKAVLPPSAAAVNQALGY